MSNHRDLFLGLFAWVATASLVTTWQIATRWGVSTSLTPIDLALLRYGIPGAILAPLALRKGLKAPEKPAWVTVLLVFGGGLPFGLLGMAGAQFAPAAHMGSLLPGSMPLFVATLSAIVLGERFGPKRVFGLCLITMAVFCITGGSLMSEAGPATLLGDGLFLLAGVSWAIYTVALKDCDLEPWHAVAIISFWSALLIVPIWLLTPSNGLLTAPRGDVALQLVVQGMLAGLFGMVVFGISVAKLGTSVTALSGSVVPALTALGGWILLGEELTALTIAGVCVMVLGLVVFSRS